MLFRKWDAFGMVEHGVGGDVVGPPSARGKLIGFVGLVVPFEDLHVRRPGGTILLIVSGNLSRSLRTVWTYIANAEDVTVLAILFDLFPIGQFILMRCFIFLSIFIEEVNDVQTLVFAISP